MLLNRVRRLLPSRGLLQQFSSLTASNIVVAATSFVTTLVLARTLGPGTFGQIVFAQGLAVVVFVLCDPRLEDALVRYVPMVERDQGEGAPTALFRRLILLDVRFAAASLLLFGGIALFSGLDLGAAYRSELVALAMLQMAAQAPYGTVGAAFGVTDGYARFGILDVVRSALTTAAGLVALALGGAEAYLGATAGCTILGTLAMTAVGMRRMRTRFGRESGRRVPLPPGLLRFAIKSSAASSVATGTDAVPMTILGAAAGPDVLGVFRVAVSPGRLVFSALSPVAGIMFPRFSRNAAARRTEAVRVAALKWTRLSTPFILLAALAGIWVLPPLVRLVFGSEYAAAATPAVLLLAASLARSTVTWSKVVSASLGRPGFRLGVVAGEAVALCLATYLLADQGADAVAVAHLVVAVASTLVWLAALGPLTRKDAEPVPT